MQQGEKDYTSKIIDNLTAFIISNKSAVSDMNIYDIYNSWSDKSEIKVEKESDVIKCLNLIKEKDKIIAGAAIISRVLEEG